MVTSFQKFYTQQEPGKHVNVSGSSRVTSLQAKAAFVLAGMKSIQHREIFIG